MDVEIRPTSDAIVFVRKFPSGFECATCVLVKQESNDVEFIRSRLNSALDSLRDTTEAQARLAIDGEDNR